MNAPMPVAFAPGIAVAGMIVSPISSRSAISASEKSRGVCRPKLPASNRGPTTEAPIRIAMRLIASRRVRFMGAGSEVAALQLVDGEGRGARGERHVGEGGIHAGGGGHAGAVGHEDVLGIPHLVVAIEHGS